MAAHDAPAGAFLAFLDPHVPLLLALLIAALFLFSRWLESGDRSAYIVGTAAAITAPAWVIGVLVVRFVWGDTAILPAASGEVTFAWVLGWVFWVLGGLLLLALLWFTLRPLWLTGLFMMAPQGQVRRRFKKLEANWQLAVATLIAAKAVVLVVALIAPWL